MVTKRRLFPSLRILHESLNITQKNENSFILSYRPQDCLFNLSQIYFRKKTDNASKLNITKLTSPSPPVTGTFDLFWNDQALYSKIYNKLSEQKKDFIIH